MSKEITQEYVENFRTKTLKIGNLVENKESWKLRKAAMHLKNQKHMARDYRPRDEEQTYVG